MKGLWDKEECVSEWQKYRECLFQHLDDKHLSRFLEADGIVDLNSRAEFNSHTLGVGIITEKPKNQKSKPKKNENQTEP